MLQTEYQPSNNRDYAGHVGRGGDEYGGGPHHEQDHPGGGVVGGRRSILKHCDKSPDIIPHHDHGKIQKNEKFCI